MSPTERDRLRDEMTVLMLTETSSPRALRRVRAETAVNWPAYDDAPGPNLYRDLQPRDVIAVCDECQRRFPMHGDAAERIRRPQRFCSRVCGYRAWTRRRREARQTRREGVA